MAKNVEVKLNLPGLNELMKSSEMQAHLAQAGRAVASAAGEEYDCATYVINYIAIENVFPTTVKAAIDNSNDNTLIKALGAVGLPLKK